MDAISLAKKLKALADSGDDYETQIARKRLEEVMLRYNLTDRDIDDVKVDYYDFRYSMPWEQKLLWQIAYKVTNSRKNCYGRRRVRSLKVVTVKCTEAQAVEIEFLYGFYQSVFNRDLDTLFHAFVQKHYLFGEADEEDDDFHQVTQLTNEERTRMASMMNGLSDADPLHALPDKES